MLFRPAYLHQSKCRSGIDSGVGLVQDAELTFSESSIDGNLPELPCGVMGGGIVISGTLHDNEIPIPLDAVGQIELQLKLDSVHSITIKGGGVRLKLLGQPKFVEEFIPPSAG